MKTYDQLVQNLTEIWTPPQCMVVSVRLEKRFAVPDVFLYFSNELRFRFTEYSHGNRRFVLWQPNDEVEIYLSGHLTAYSNNDTIFDNIDGYGAENSQGRDARVAFAQKWSPFLLEKAKLCGNIVLMKGGNAQ